MNPLTKIFATEEISKAIIALGFNDTCLADHAGFKNFGESDDKMKYKQVVPKNETTWAQLQRKYNMAFFDICPAPVWQQVTDFLRDTYDIDIDITQIRHDSEFRFLFSVMIAGKLVHSGRTVTYNEALEKSVLSAIDLCVKN
jgi:hypothetical protein